MNKSFWPAFALMALLLGTAIQAFSVERIGPPAERPRIPVPGQTYISATRDGQTDQSLFYFNLFGFGDRIRKADVLVLGSSHAEFGIEAAKLGERGFNMALGGESLAFAAVLLRKYRPSPPHVVIDPFSPDVGLSTEARRTMALGNGAQALHSVLNIWSGFLRDWILQGLLPRITIRPGDTSFEEPLATIIVRDWQTADVTAVYSGSRGEVFATTSNGHEIATGAERKGARTDPSDLTTIRATGASIIITTIPYPAFDETIGRETAKDLGGRFVSIDPRQLLFFDYHHLNATGRSAATEALSSPP